MNSSKAEKYGIMHAMNEQMHSPSPEEMPLVSVAVVSYRDFSGWERTLRSILEQDYPRMELVFQDDGSPEFAGYEPLIKDYLRENRRENLLSYTVVGLPENVGTVENFNSALAGCSGVYWRGFGLGDCFADSHSLSRHVELAVQSGAELVFGRVRAFSAEDGRTVSVIPAPERQAYMMALNSRELFDLMMSYRAVVSPGALIQMDMFRELGGFDRRFRIVEDYHFWLRCFQQGRRALFVNDILGAYEVSGQINGTEPILSEARIREAKLAFDLFNASEDHRYGPFQGLFNRLYLELHVNSALRARRLALENAPAWKRRLCKLEQQLLKGVLRVCFPPVPGKPRLPRERLSDC